MKRTIVALATVGLLGAVALAQVPDAGKAAPKASGELKDMKDKVSYSIGVSIARQILSQKAEINGDVLSQGLKDGLAGKTILTDVQMREVMQAYEQSLIAKQQEMVNKVKEEGEAFLAQNKKKKGVTTTASGLQYEILKEGTGKQPKPTDTVLVNYKGTLIDGTVFDSTEGKAPLPLQVNRVIPGWIEALQLMKEGSKWRLYIPSQLAYGPNPRPGGPIRPNDALIFDVELIKIQ